MHKSVRGFTLIELIVVIVILGILAATAMPKFVAMQKNARIAALQGAIGGIRAAGALTSASYFSSQKDATLGTDYQTMTLPDSSTIVVNKTSQKALGWPQASHGGLGVALACPSTPIALGSGYSKELCNGLTFLHYNNGVNFFTFIFPAGLTLSDAELVSYSPMQANACHVMYYEQNMVIGYPDPLTLVTDGC